LQVVQALGKLATTAHLPEELLGNEDTGPQRKGRKRRRNADGTFINLDEYVKKEQRKEKEDGTNSDDDEEDADRPEFDIAPGDVDDVDDEEEEEEEDNHDYTTNYYESAGESDDGADDGEATF
jgi:hypothetical protein